MELRKEPVTLDEGLTVVVREATWADQRARMSLWDQEEKVDVMDVVEESLRLTLVGVQAENKDIKLKPGLSREKFREAIEPFPQRYMQVWYEAVLELNPQWRPARGNF